TVKDCLNINYKYDYRGKILLIRQVDKTVWVVNANKKARQQITNGSAAKKNSSAAIFFRCRAIYSSLTRQEMRHET
ncbi:MAG: hypothetical protein RRZ65_01445, partial [Tannerellaceae bacterium]